MQMTTVTPWIPTSRASYQDPGKAGMNATKEVLINGSLVFRFRIWCDKILVSVTGSTD